MSALGMDGDEACGLAFDLGMELGRKELLLASALYVGERHRAAVVKLIDSHGTLAVELGSALFQLRKAEERAEGREETIAELKRALDERNEQNRQLSAENARLRFGGDR